MIGIAEQVASPLWSMPRIRDPRYPGIIASNATWSCIVDVGAGVYPSKELILHGI
jgi:hypothetical protein